jgi:hypothetical protein
MRSRSGFLYIPAGVRTAAVVLALAACLGVVRTAAAAGEHEWQLALRLGAATVSVDDRKPWGLAAGIDVDYGLTDSWAVRLSFQGSTHNVSKSSDMDMRPEGAIRADAVLLGLTYTFDVLRLVPYADVQAGIAQLRGAVTTPQSLLAMEVGVGADYFISRRVTAGISFHYLFEPADLLSDPLNLGTNPFQFTATARGSYLF